MAKKKNRTTPALSPSQQAVANAGLPVTPTTATTPAAPPAQTPALTATEQMLMGAGLPTTSSAGNTPQQTQQTATNSRENLGITEALLADPEYGAEIKKVFDLYRAGRTTEAKDELYKTKFGRLRPEAQTRVLERAERSEIYKEDLRKFIINTRKTLRALSLDATDQQLEDYYVKGTPAEIIQDDIIKKGTFKPEAVGGAGLDNLTRLQTLARKNGVSEKSLPLVLGYQSMDEVGRALAGGEDITVFERKIRNYGTTAMPDWVKNQVASGLEVEDVIAPYRGIVAEELDIPVAQIDVTNRYIQDALAKNMNLSDFRRTVRKDPSWQYTEGAKDVVRNSLRAVLGGGI